MNVEKSAAHVNVMGNAMPKIPEFPALTPKPGRVRGYTDDILASSATLARAMRGGLLDTGLPMANYYARNGIKSRTDLGTLNMSDVPAVMVELGNMKNASDARRMTTKGGRSLYAAGLVAGIRAYLGR